MPAVRPAGRARRGRRSRCRCRRRSRGSVFTEGTSPTARPRRTRAVLERFAACAAADSSSRRARRARSSSPASTAAPSGAARRSTPDRPALRERERDGVDSRDASCAPPGEGGRSARASTCSTAPCATASTARATRAGSSRRSTGLADGRRSRGRRRRFVETGKGVMPAFAVLPRRRIEAVASHVLGEPERDHGAGRGGAVRARPYTHHGYNRFLDPDGYPAVTPPWGTLNAIDLNTGEIALAGAARRVPGADGARHSADRHRELRRAGRHRRRTRLHRRDEGRDVPRVRHEDRPRAVAGEAARRRLRDARRRTRRTAGSSSSSPLAAARWGRRRAMLRGVRAAR